MSETSPDSRADHQERRFPYVVERSPVHERTHGVKRIAHHTDPGSSSHDNLGLLALLAGGTTAGVAAVSSVVADPYGRTRMIVFPLIRSVGLRAATASSRVATVPMFVRSRPSRTRRTISLSWARSASTTKSTARPSA